MKDVPSPAETGYKARSAFGAVLLLSLALGAPHGAQAEVKSAPPKDVKLVEQRFDKLSSTDFGEYGSRAYAMEQKKWKHAETESFLVHYRRVTEAQRAVREIEYALWFVADMLNIPRERYAAKSHVFIFQDRKEWNQFLLDGGVPPWTGSFAYGGDLFLFIGSATEPFDSKMLAHEVAHAALARMYPGRRLPRWLNEGFAEYVGAASIASRTKQYLKGVQNELNHATLSLAKLVEMADYPTGQKEVHQFYQTSERFVRFLIESYPKEKFPAFLEAIFDGSNPLDAIKTAYDVEFQDFAALERQYGRFRH